MNKGVEMPELLLYFSIKYNGVFEDIYNALSTHEPFEEEDVCKVLNDFSKEGIKYVTILDENYPKCFKGIHCPPFVIYYDGDISDDVLLTEEEIFMDSRFWTLSSNLTICERWQHMCADQCLRKLGKIITQ